MAEDSEQAMLVLTKANMDGHEESAGVSENLSAGMFVSYIPVSRESISGHGYRIAGDLYQRPQTHPRNSTERLTH